MMIRWSMAHADSLEPRIHGHNWVLDENLDKQVQGVLESWIMQNWHNRTIVNVNHPIFKYYIEGDGRFDIEIFEMGFIPVSFDPTVENISAYLSRVACEELDCEGSNPELVKVYDNELSIV